MSDIPLRMALLDTAWALATALTVGHTWSAEKRLFPEWPNGARARALLRGGSMPLFGAPTCDPRIKFPSTKGSSRRPCTLVHFRSPNIADEIVAEGLQ